MPEQPVERNNIDIYNVIDSSGSGDIVENNVNILSTQEDKDQTYVIGAKRIPLSNDRKDPYISLNTASLSPKERSMSVSPPARSRGNSPTHKTSPHVVSEPLLCPKCNKEFTSTEHPELLEHIEHCAN